MPDDFKVYYDQDADPEVLKDKKIAIIGYGSQGHAHAQNLRDSGCNVTVAELEGSANWNTAKEHGFEPETAATAAQAADIVMILVPDQYQAGVYKEQIAPGLAAGNTLMFAHGFNIHFKTIVPPEDVDVVMVAPKAPGHTVREQFVQGGGVPCLVAVYRNPSGRARDTALAWARGIGCTRAGALETTFKVETESDLFGEQAVLCGGICELINAGFETLVEAGYPPECAYFECLHEMFLIVRLMVQGGMSYMRYSISDTAEYGDYTRGKRVIGAETRSAMKQILKEVQDGTFAKEWLAECEAGASNLKRMRAEGREALIETVGRKLRALMPFVDPKEVPAE